VEVGKFMKDVDGVEIVAGDLVYWRAAKHEPFGESGKILRVREKLGLCIIQPTSRYYDGVHKASRNIKKMPVERAMLWQLENA
jgi:hypothetical protein